MTDDVEKRWDRPRAFRAAATYVAVVVAVAALAFVLYAVVSKTSVVAASTVPLILFLGGVGAFVRTYREWKAKGTWVQWQGAGWFLLILMLVCLSIPGAAMMAD
ncbi:hypothetical protein QGN32_09995 [Mycolicibacterium sp. ND9-15]|uniref:hypothetical protein n=1 Tax=Mycolicibacterium sp. ND9-15 TaxID=3042320 RepID=UPI002DDB8A43|nr:hypothetical protein [Mycolicibacterium sp. ND9-15]WSE58149.1 hypothetical protein QGN32_09995 [Mycolicibacterium sp. ND9-15]